MFGASAHPFWPRTWTTTWASIFLGEACLGTSPVIFRLSYWVLIASILILNSHWKNFCHRFRLQMTYFKHWQRSPFQHGGLLAGLLSLIILSGLIFKAPNNPAILQNNLFETLLLVSLWPFLEELFFRGWLQPILRNEVTRNGVILITASLFTLSHTAYWGQISLLLPIFLLGLATGYLRQRYFSLWPGLILHISYNVISLFLFYSRFNA